MTDEIDVVVIGGGPVGENAAGRVAAGGLGVALVEADLVGGECSYWACIPSKALLRPGHALAAARRVPGAREAVTGGVDAKAALARRDHLTSGFDDSSQVAWAEGAGLTVLRGWGRLAGERTVQVERDGERRTLTARHAVVVCTGSVPVTPQIDGLADVPHWGSREATAAHEVPGRLAVIGGGVVACEMAQAWARLGSSVTLVQRGPRLLDSVEPVAADLVADGLRADGIVLHLGATTRRVSRADGSHGPVRVELDGGEVVEADELLVATGRRPNTADIGLAAVGLEAGRPLSVDDAGRVPGVGWLYAAGDVTGRAPLTHQGKYGARVVGDVILAATRGEHPPSLPWTRYAATADSVAVPQVVFTDPEVAAVGRTAVQAQADGVRTRVIDLDIAVAGSSLHAEGYRGVARMVVDEDRRVLVGLTFAGPDVAEMLHAATIAVVGEVPLDRLWHAVPAFPTISEVWLRLLEAYGL